MKQIICMKWGTLYGADYVNNLYSMVDRNITGPFRFVCLTDNRDGIRDEVECHECPTIELPKEKRNLPFRKLNLWGLEIPGLKTGEPALFLDLDVVITGNIDCFFEYDAPNGEDFIVCENWTSGNGEVGNTSVYRFIVGSHPYLLTNMIENHSTFLKKYRNSQTYISREIKKGSMHFWPATWCRSFKVHCVPKWPLRWIFEPKLPEDTRIVIFPGTPNPHEAMLGKWPGPWYKKCYKYIRPTRWVAENWN